MDVNTEQSMEQSILETAERLFLEKGFVLTSTTEIAKEVGCNQALVHYYFRTKDNLFNTIFEQKFKLFFQHIFDLGNLDELSFTDKLKHIIESHFDMLNANPKLPLLIISEFSRRPEQVGILKEKLQTVPQKLFEKLNAQLNAEISAGKIRQTTLADLILTMVSLNVSLFLFIPIAGEIASLNEAQRQFMIVHRREEHVNVILNSIRP
ncbi:MAG: TetR/AcrR family transcriptional regulator [Paludibacter sp.]|nr:TetR/AcrR family transcriptional regulator [Paludibacter sp.]